MFKKSVVLIYMLVVLVLLSACSSSKLQEIDGLTELRFKDTIETSELRKLDSKKVSMIGFMSTSTPLNGEYTYLMNMPYQDCAFCVPNTDSLVNTIAVYTKDGKSFEFTDVPVKVTGILVFENTIDSMGYTYEYKIKDAILEVADVSELEEDIKIYTNLINQGFAESMDTIFIDLYNTLYSKEDIENLDLIATNSIKDIKVMFDNLDKSNYEDIISIVNSIESLVDDINYSINVGDDSKFKEYKTKEDELYTQYCMWLIKPEI